MHPVNVNGQGDLIHKSHAPRTSNWKLCIQSAPSRKIEQALHSNHGSSNALRFQFISRSPTSTDLHSSGSDHKTSHADLLPPRGSEALTEPEASPQQLERSRCERQSRKKLHNVEKVGGASRVLRSSAVGSGLSAADPGGAQFTPPPLKNVVALPPPIFPSQAPTVLPFCLHIFSELESVQGWTPVKTSTPFLNPSEGLQKRLRPLFRWMRHASRPCPAFSTRS